MLPLLVGCCKYGNVNLHFILVSPLCHLRKKEPSSCFTNSSEDRFKLIADFVESEFLSLFYIMLSDISCFI